jgi:predicted GIY-YIG superfamily endonuclease
MSESSGGRPGWWEGPSREPHLDVRAPFERERQLKKWPRAKKILLIESVNAGWLDLAADWFPDS